MSLYKTVMLWFSHSLLPGQMLKGNEIWINKHDLCTWEVPGVTWGVHEIIRALEGKKKSGLNCTNIGHLQTLIEPRKL